MPDYDQIQADCTELIKDFLRRELGKDYYNGNVQAVVVTTNKVTGRVNIDACNVPLDADIKKMLREAYEQIQRSQMSNALASVLAIYVDKKLKRRGK